MWLTYSRKLPLIFVLWAAIAGAVSASEKPEEVGKSFRDVVALAQGADVVVLGEIHDNPTHHANQSEIIAELSPKAIVWEMLTAEQANRLTPRVLQDAPEDASSLGEILQWSSSGWPVYSMYQPIFAASLTAHHYGAQVQRSAARGAMTQSVVEIFQEHFDGDAALLGLDAPLSSQEQSLREAAQMSAHCDALPEQMLPTMVDIQRLRDARLAQQVLRALAATGGPVAVVTGNGHARQDRGLPVYLRHARRDVEILTVGQSEEGQIEGEFDMVLDAQAIARPDPCSAFR